MILSFVCTDEMHGQRLDKALTLREEIETRSRAAHLINENLVIVNGRVSKPSLIVKSGDQIEIHLPEPEPTELIGYDFALDILFEDDDVIVINKPSGLVVHPAAGHAQDTLVNALIFHAKNLSMKFGENRPGIVHRLDKETSGVLVVAKNDRAHENLTRQFKARTTNRVYFAVCIGILKPPSGKLESFLARHPTDRKRYSSQTEGKWAITNYETLKSHSGLSYCRLKLETGRTHQIRVHLSEKGAPIAGDIMYGADKKIKSLASLKVQTDIRGLKRFLLHAAELGFVHPTTGQWMSFFQDWPSDVMSLLKVWGFDEGY
jgi:23S rRNA pseudouridine1911/1915/1917 synthase